MGARWSDAEKAQLETLVCKGQHSYDEIAAMIGRSKTACQICASQNGWRMPGRKGSGGGRRVFRNFKSDTLPNQYGHNNGHQIAARFPSSLMWQVRLYARDHNTSLNGAINALVRAGLEHV